MTAFENNYGLGVGPRKIATGSRFSIHFKIRSQFYCGNLSLHHNEIKSCNYTNVRSPIVDKNSVNLGTNTIRVRGKILQNNINILYAVADPGFWCSGGGGTFSHKLSTKNLKN